jgi:hypothetical protein
MSWKPSGPKDRQPRALVVGLRRIVKDSRRVFGRGCELANSWESSRAISRAIAVHLPVVEHGTSREAAPME